MRAATQPPPSHAPQCLVLYGIEAKRVLHTFEPLRRRRLSSIVAIIFALVVVSRPVAAHGRITVIEGLYDLTFTPRTPVISVVKTRQPETITATLSVVREDQLISAFQRHGKLLADDVGNPFPVREVTSDPTSGTDPVHRIDFGMLPIGEYVLALKAVDATGIQRISVTSLGTFVRVIGTRWYVLALDLRTLRGRPDVTFAVYRSGQPMRKRADATGFANFVSEASDSNLLTAKADDGSVVVQAIQWGGTPSGTRSYMMTDRPVYRPGDAVRYWGVARTGTAGNLGVPSSPGWFFIEDKTKVFERGSVTPGTAGTYFGTYAIPTTAIPGDYSIDSAYGSAKFAVDNQVTQPFILRLSPAADTVRKGDEATFDAMVTDVFGLPVAGIRLTGQAAGSVWSDPFAMRDPPLDPLGAMSAVTDAAGKAHLSIKTGERLNSGNLIVATVTASNGHGWTAKARAAERLAAASSASGAERVGGDSVVPSAVTAKAGQTVLTHITSSLADGDVLVETGSGEPAVQIVRIKSHEAWVPVIVPAHGTSTHIGLMVPGTNNTSRAEVSIAIQPPTDELSIAVHADKPYYRPASFGRIAVDVRDAKSLACSASLLVSVTRLAAAMLRQEPQHSIYDTIYETWNYQPFGIQSWWGLNASPESALLPTPAPRPSGEPSTTDTYIVGHVAAQPSVPPHIRPSALASGFVNAGSPDTIMWLPSEPTDARGRSLLHVKWPDKADAYLVRVIAVTLDGKIGESTTTIVVR